MIVYETFKEAERIILGRIDIPGYYKLNIDNQVDLSDTHVNCPLHDDGTASFQYHSETDTFYCHGCMRGGNVIVLHKFIMKQEIGEDDDGKRVTYSKSMVNLAKKLGIPIPNFYIDNALTEYTKFTIQKLPEFNINTIVLPYKAVVSKVEKKLQQLKTRDFGEFMKLIRIVESIEICGESEEEKIGLYSTVFNI